MDINITSRTCSVLLLCLAFGLSCIAFAQTSERPTPIFEIATLSPEQAATIAQTSWQPHCPVPLEDLRLVAVAYWGYDGNWHQGALIVHAQVASEVQAIFQELFEQRFPFTSILPIDAFDGDDARSMAANNTSAFNCRKKTGQSKAFSRHSYGLAIDINPLVNPYIKRGRIEPPGGREYQDRTRRIPGMIALGDACYHAFRTRGWMWGGPEG
jgi:hypothetical protein